MSGARIEVADACAPPSKGSPAAGVLHLVNQLLPHTNLTVADLLEQDPQFSVFVELLDTFNILQFLRKFAPYTVFAPNDASFDIYMDALDCLTFFERGPLNDLLLYHILDAAEYSSTLKARDVVYTKLLQPLVVEEGHNGQIFLVGTDEPVPISQPDLLASNGVVHGIPSLLIPRYFDLGVCADLVTMPPPVNISDPSPSTVATSPSTVATSPSTVATSPSFSAPFSTIINIPKSPSPSSTAVIMPSGPPAPVTSPSVNVREGFGPGS